MLRNLHRTSIGFKFIMPISLLTIKGIGWQLNTSQSYVWNGRERAEYIWNGKKSKDEHCLFQYTLGGEGEIEIEGNLYKLKPGDAFIVEIPGQHCYRLPPDSSEWEVLYIEFSKEALPFWHQLLTMKGPVFSIEPDSDFIKLAWKTYEMAVKDQFNNVYQCSKYAYQLIMELISHFYQDHKTKSLTSKIELCKQFIAMHYKEQIGLDDMSQAVGLSKFHLTREFEKELGITPGRYLTKVRLENSAILLLSSKNMNLESIAKQVGFSCANYFGKVFRNNIGVSPDEFRKSNSSYDVNRILFEK